MTRIKKIIGSPFVRKWFLTLLAFVTTLFLCFMLYTHINSTKALQIEYTSYSELQAERIAGQLDDNFKSYSRVAALLSLNKMIRIYLFDEDTDILFTDIHSQLNNQLAAYTEGFPAIDSIFLFPASGKEVFTSNFGNPVAYQSLNDKNCLSIQEAPDTMALVPREKNERYPYLITIYLPLFQQDQKSLIVLNINLSDIPLLRDVSNDSIQKIYIVSDEGELLHRSQQRDMPEPLELVPQLRHFDSTKESYSHYDNGDTPYIYSQQHSEKYPWYYVTVTTPQSYMEKSYNFYENLLTILPWLLILTLLVIVWLVLLATHPMRTISDFLENPLPELPDNISEPETKKIIRHFINYMQTNRSLSEELEKQMEQGNKATYRALQAQINPHFLFNTLNLIRNMEIETLGYDHEAPELTLSLSRLMRYALDCANLVPLKTEFYYTELYLRILNLRYREKLHFNIVGLDAVSDLLVPKLILQPLIENAVFHGCAPSLDTHNTILVDTMKEGELCTITVDDNGVGIPAESLELLRSKLSRMDEIPSDSIGLQNVVFRMYLTYGDAFCFAIDSEPGKGTRISLTFPAVYTKEQLEEKNVNTGLS